MNKDLETQLEIKKRLRSLFAAATRRRRRYFEQKKRRRPPSHSSASEPAMIQLELNILDAQLELPLFSQS